MLRYVNSICHHIDHHIAITVQSHIIIHQCKIYSRYVRQKPLQKVSKAKALIKVDKTKAIAKGQ